MTNNPKLTQANLDKLLTIVREVVDEGRSHKPLPIIWGAKAIGARIGKSDGYVRKTLAKREGSPVCKDESGKIYAFEADLIEYLQKQRAA